MLSIYGLRIQTVKATCWIFYSLRIQTEPTCWGSCSLRIQTIKAACWIFYSLRIQTLPTYWAFAVWGFKLLKLRVEHWTVWGFKRDQHFELLQFEDSNYLSYALQFAVWGFKRDQHFEHLQFENQFFLGALFALEGTKRAPKGLNSNY